MKIPLSSKEPRAQVTAQNGRVAPAGSFLRASAASVAYCLLMGGSAHMISAFVAHDIYDMYLGVQSWSGPRIESLILAAFIFGAYVSWWVGLLAAPVVYVIAGGSHEKWRASKVAVAAAIGMASSALALIATSGFRGWGIGFGNAIFLAVLDYGYILLGFGLIVLAISLRKMRTGGQANCN